MLVITVFILGTVIGSFLNVCIYRIPKGKSVVVPPSHCPYCGKGIAWFDNIPIISYLALRGRCRLCKKPISFRYILVELLTAFILVSLFLTFRESLSRFFGYSILASGLIVATFVDIELTEIPDEVSLGCLVLGMIFGFVFPANLGESSHIFGLLASIAGAAAGGLSIYLMGAFGKALFRKEAMGGGDVKLMAMIGSFLGWKLVLLAFFIAPISGAIVGIVLKIRDGQEVIPYGPHLSLAALVTVFWGEKIVRLFGYR